MILLESIFISKIILISMFMLLISCSSNEQNNKKNTQNDMQIETSEKVTPKIKRYYIKITNSIPHDEKAYTQGFLFHNGYIYESTGQYGESSLRKIDPFTGKILQKVSIPSTYFAEGIAIVNDKIYLLTWQELTCFVYDLKTFKQITKFNYQGEGWGLTEWNKKLIMSDGTNYLKYINPSNFKIEKTLSVLDNSRSISNLNELEIINGELWANVYLTDVIAIINPENGNITGYIDCSLLRANLVNNPSAEVLNGIAYDSTNNKLWLTGKNWNKIFTVEIIEQE